MADVFVPSNILGPLIAATLENHVASGKTHCPNHCALCNSVLWLRDNAPDMASVAVKRLHDPDHWSWQRQDGSIDWGAVTKMFVEEKDCFHDDHTVNDTARTGGPDAAS